MICNPIKPSFIKKYSAICCFLIFCFNSNLAQKFNFDTLKKKFPDEKALVLKHTKLYTLSIKNKKVDVNAMNYEETIALNDNGISAVNNKYVYSSFFVKNKIQTANTLFLQESGKYKTIEARDIKEKSDRDSYVFFDDSKTTTISYPSVTSGSITTLKNLEEYGDVRVFGAYYFSSFIPTLQSEVTVKVHKNIQIKYLLKNCSELNIDFSVVKKGKYIYYSWKAKNVDKYHKPESSPNLKYFIPHILFYVTGFESKHQKIDVLSSTTDLYKWYAKLITNVNTQSSDKLKKISDSLVAGSTTELEKVKKIFYWVQDNIKYIAFEDGLGGQVPREAFAVYEKRYGDCKDMASIITQMLKLTNIKAHLTWIGTRDIPYTYNEVPTPISDNHMIAAYKDSTGKVWLLDGTGKNASIEFYTSMIQGKQALIGLDSNKYEIFDVPIIENNKNSFIDSIYVEIDKEQIAGKGKLKISGYPKINLDYLHFNLTEKEFKDALIAKLQKGNNTFDIDTCLVLNASKREVPTIIDYSCKINNYVKSYEKELYFNFNLDKDELKYLINDSRGNIPIEFDNTISNISTVVLKIPDGCEVNYLPKNTSYSHPDFGYTIQYEKKNNFLIMKKHFFCKKLMIYPIDFNEWNKMIKSLNNSYNESIILKQK